MSVKRYNVTGDYAYPVSESLDGEFVAHDDYAADLARLTAELDRKQRECDGMRLWAEALEKDWLIREQWALIDGGMRLEQALIHANARMKQARAATIKAALSAGEKE